MLSKEKNSSSKKRLSYKYTILHILIIFIRKKKDIDVINDNDDAIAKMIADMRIGEHSSPVHHEKYTISVNIGSTP